jgi:hypothetical protein
MSIFLIWIATPDKLSIGIREICLRVIKWMYGLRIAEARANVTQTNDHSLIFFNHFFYV